jgi:hypothetical protein
MVNNFNQLINTILFIILLGILNITEAQDYQQAPEIWSTPIKLDSISKKFIGERFPSLTKNLDTLYFHQSEVIKRSVKLNGIWQYPVSLNENVNNSVPTRHPTISKDGRRLYYCAWSDFDVWDIFFNDWNESTGDWGPRINMGSVINHPGIDYYLYEVSRDNIYTITDQWKKDGLSEYTWSDSLNEWVLIENFIGHSDFRHGEFWGLSITSDKRKCYYGLRPWDTNILEERGLELCVSYWDSTTDNWGQSYYLNINSKPFIPDTNVNENLSGTDIFPWISADGKTLYYQSDFYAGTEDSVDFPDILVSYLLVDENGDTVVNKLDSFFKPTPFFELKQNYPNPFNPKTVIRYQLNSNSNVLLSVFDVNGKKITNLVNSFQFKGNYSISFNASDFNISSGIYFYRIKAGNLSKTQKMIYMQ